MVAGMKKNLLPAFALLALFPLAATAAPLTRADVEAIVGQYLETHGDKTLAGIARYQQQKQAAQAAAVIKYYNPTKGPKNAPVTIVEFLDYECPFCSRVQPTLEQLRGQYGARIRWVAKYLPLSFHPKARPAAYAAQAAHIQGKFWEYNDKLWERQEFLGDQTYEAIAKELGLNMDKFNKDRASAAVKAAVDGDLADAQSVGAGGTPYFLINGKALSGAQPAEAFTDAIEEALKKSNQK